MTGAVCERAPQGCKARNPPAADFRSLLCTCIGRPAPAERMMSCGTMQHVAAGVVRVQPRRNRAAKLPQTCDGKDVDARRFVAKLSLQLSRGSPGLWGRMPASSPEPICSLDHSRMQRSAVRISAPCERWSQRPAIRQHGVRPKRTKGAAVVCADLDQLTCVFPPCS